MLQKRKLLIFLSLIACATGSLCLAAPSMTKWKGFGTIEANGPNRFKAVFLEPEIYRSARTDLADLRLLDSEGRSVPYILENGEDAVSQSEFANPSVRVLAYNKKNNSIFDFKVLPIKKETDAAGNILELSLPSTDFLKEVEFFGSFDGDTWTYLGKTRIYRVNGVVNNRFSLGSRLKYGYYRIKLLNNPERLQISGLNLVDQDLSEEWSLFEKSTVLPSSIRQKGQFTFIDVNNLNRLKVKRIDLQIDGHFKRAVEVFGQDGQYIPVADPWIYQFSFRNQEATRTWIQFENLCSSRVLHIKIANLNDRPLKIGKISVRYALDKLTFEGGNKEKYRLYFGNPEAEKAEYDMEQFRSSILAENYDILKIKDIKIETKQGIKPSGKQTALFFNLALGFVAVLMVILLLRRITSKS